MRKRNLILPLFLGSFFITSNVDSSVIDLYENKNSNNNLLIAGDCGGGGGGGGGGGMTIKEKKENDLKKAIKTLEFFESKKAAAEAKGESTTEIDKKIKKWEKKIIKLDPNYFDATQKKSAEPEVLPDMVKDIIYKFNQTLNKIITIRETIRNTEHKGGDFFDFLDEKYANIKNLDILVSFIEGSKNETVRLYKESTKADLNDLQKRIREYKKDKFPRIKNILEESEKYLPKKLADEVEQIYDFTWRWMEKVETGILLLKANSENNYY